MTNNVKLAIASVVIVMIGGALFWSSDRGQRNSTNASNTATAEYSPVIDPANFVAAVDNPYFTLKPGAVFTYETKTDEGTERIEVAVTDETKVVAGVTTTVVRDRVWLDNVLIEDTRDFYAQDDSGTVWYFGEEVDNYEEGALKDHAGSWEAGVDGAKAGVIMEADPVAGDTYRQEYYRGKAEDMADVVATDLTVTVPVGTYEGCLQTRDWSTVETALNEYKYYCPDVGFMVLEEPVGGGERTQLIKATGV